MGVLAVLRCAQRQICMRTWSKSKQLQACSDIHHACPRECPGLGLDCLENTVGGVRKRSYCVQEAGVERQCMVGVVGVGKTARRHFPTDRTLLV